MTIRSSVGLALAAAEIETEPGRWRPVELSDGACDLEGALRVRAPGHLPAAVVKGDREVLLEPDALLLVEARGLRGCIRTLAPGSALIPMSAQLAAEWEATSASFLSAGFVSADRWAMAVSSRRAARFGDGQSYADFVRRDYRRGWIQFQASPGARVRWEMPCDCIQSVAPLDLRVVRAADEPAGEIELRAWRIGPQGDQQLVRESFPWGVVAMMAPENVFFSARIGAAEATARVEGVPLGLHYSLTVRDVGSSAYGRLEFEHDGTARTVEMQGGIVLAGRLRDTAGNPVRRARLEWSAHDVRKNTEDMSGWGGETPFRNLPEDGSFEIRVPSRVAVGRESQLAPPRELLLGIDAPGYERFEGVVALPGRRQDCGEIVLVSLPPEIILAPGHDLDPDALESMWVRLGGASELFPVHAALRRPDGSLAIFLELERKEEGPNGARYRAQDPRTPSASSSTLPKTPVELISVHYLTPQHGDAGRAFGRRTDGAYERLPSVVVHADVHCRTMPSTRKDWTIGWEWNGLWDTCAVLGLESEGERLTFDWSVPSPGAKLWWSPSHWPPWLDEIAPTESGTKPIEEGTLRLQLP